jgi:hypothetical protein
MVDLLRNNCIAMTIQEIIRVSGLLPDSIRGDINADFETKPYRDGGYYSCMWEIRKGHRARMIFIACGDSPEESNEKLKKLIMEDERRSTQRNN